MTNIDVTDEFEIRLLYARYARAIDEGDGEAWAACYTSDGTYWSSTFGTRTGRPALRDFAVNHCQEWHDQGIRTQHWISQTLLEPAPWGIAARTYVLLMGTTAAGPPTAMLQTEYHDQLVREDGSWRLHRRESHAQCSLNLPPTVDS
ncbi:uncharacterized protein (TIGR02246 family) [Tamaricihabitans halophyticus]|uniref:Uncharacterized protein (TIGR02246 family) n=1 Tax=Tamaricihabitans halophyticus TaxID=1262583 RepID=A0A4R2R780_9PSEU|nr:nuclear transport factor 2 family protein [Tamaricihabitans halophyticus]TCP55255.1 uncharacterized protein (TIGR02246 family) [Tamaricihabitans halophyticus]